MKRRDFVKIGGLGTTALIIDGCKAKGNSEKKEILPLTHLNQIKVISTWNSGINANKAATVSYTHLTLPTILLV